MVRLLTRIFWAFILRAMMVRIRVTAIGNPSGTNETMTPMSVDSMFDRFRKFGY